MTLRGPFNVHHVKAGRRSDRWHVRGERKSRVRFTAEEDAILIAEVAKEAPVREIAKLLNRSHGSVYARAMILELPLISAKRTHGAGAGTPVQGRGVLGPPIAGKDPPRANDDAFVKALNAAGGYPYRHILDTGRYVLVTHDGRPHVLNFGRAR